jgi:hypothetical protein
VAALQQLPQHQHGVVAKMTLTPLPHANQMSLLTVLQLEGFQLLPVNLGVVVLEVIRVQPLQGLTAVKQPAIISV